MESGEKMNKVLFEAVIGCMFKLEYEIDRLKEDITKGVYKDSPLEFARQMLANKEKQWLALQSFIDGTIDEDS